MNHTVFIYSLMKKAHDLAVPILSLNTKYFLSSKKNPTTFKL